MSRWPLFSISPGNEEEMNSRSATLGLTNDGSLPNVDQLCTVIIYLILFSVYCMANGIRSPSVFTCFVCVSVCVLQVCPFSAKFDQNALS